MADEGGADEVDRDAVALQDDLEARERFAAVADEVHRTRQRAPGGSGCARPRGRSATRSGSRQGSASNCLAVHAFCSVVNRDGSAFGSSTLTLAMFGVVPCVRSGRATFAVRLAPLALLVFPLVETENFGANFRCAQFVTWNGVANVLLAPLTLVIAPPTLNVSLAQLVGLNVKPGRLISMSTRRSLIGMPVV